MVIKSTQALLPVRGRVDLQVEPVHGGGDGPEVELVLPQVRPLLPGWG